MVVRASGVKKTKTATFMPVRVAGGHSIVVLNVIGYLVLGSTNTSGRQDAEYLRMKLYFNSVNIVRFRKQPLL